MRIRVKAKVYDATKAGHQSVVREFGTKRRRTQAKNATPARRLPCHSPTSCLYANAASHPRLCKTDPRTSTRVFHGARLSGHGVGASTSSSVKKLRNGLVSVRAMRWTGFGQGTRETRSCPSPRRAAPAGRAVVRMKASWGMSRMSLRGRVLSEAATEARGVGVGMRNACCARMVRLVLELIARLAGAAGVQSRDEIVKALGKVHIALSDEEWCISVSARAEWVARGWLILPVMIVCNPRACLGSVDVPYVRPWVGQLSSCRSL